MAVVNNQHDRTFALLLLVVLILSFVPAPALALEAGNMSCFESWHCTDWSPCVDNIQTQECTFECTVEPCLEDSTVVRKCEMPQLTVSTDKAEAKFGDAVQISVVDDDGKEVAADLQVNRPDGCTISLSGNQYRIEQDGPIIISAKQEGYYGAQIRALGYGAPKPSPLLSEPIFYALLMVVLILLVYLIWHKTRKKSTIERL